MSDNQNPFRDHGGPIKPGRNKVNPSTGRPEYAYYNPKEGTVSDKFEQITNNFHTTRQERTPMTRQRTPMNAATAIGTLLILAGILALIPWGFGADRFLWIAAGTGGAGIILATVGALTPKEKR